MEQGQVSFPAILAAILYNCDKVVELEDEANPGKKIQVPLVQIEKGESDDSLACIIPMDFVQKFARETYQVNVSRLQGKNNDSAEAVLLAFQPAGKVPSIVDPSGRSVMRRNEAIERITGSMQ